MNIDLWDEVIKNFLTEKISVERILWINLSFTSCRFISPKLYPKY